MFDWTLLHPDLKIVFVITIEVKLFIPDPNILDGHTWEPTHSHLSARCLIANRTESSQAFLVSSFTSNTVQKIAINNQN